MRERHKERFMEATADLRSKLKVTTKRIRLLETQLLKNSVSSNVYTFHYAFRFDFICVFIYCSGCNDGLE